jgi:type II secretory pathway pseudopilin PulG
MNTRFQKGFTIVETLVAITILMIAIAGPLTVANKAYTAALDARNVAIANNLAQEGLEELNNFKDNLTMTLTFVGSNQLYTIAWSSFEASYISGDQTSGCVTATVPISAVGACGISLGVSSNLAFNGDALTVGHCDNNNNCQLTQSDMNLGYTYGTSYTSGAGDVSTTPFTRYFYLTQTGSDVNQYLATVVVSWNTGSVSNQVQLQELLTNYPRQ